MKEGKREGKGEEGRGRRGRGREGRKEKKEEGRKKLVLSSPVYSLVLLPGATAVTIDSSGGSVHTPAFLTEGKIQLCLRTNLIKTSETSKD